MKAKKTSKMSLEQKVIILAIVLVSIVVIISVVLALVLKPENQIQRKVSALSADYYENHIYADILNNNGGGDISEVLKNYEETGLSTVYLRQILLSDLEKNADFYEYFKKYCDENKTSVKFYPESPYGQKSYRAEYSYSCEY